MYVKVKLRNALPDDFTELGKRRLGLLYFLQNQNGQLEAYIFNELHQYTDLEPVFKNEKIFVVDARQGLTLEDRNAFQLRPEVPLQP